MKNNKKDVDRKAILHNRRTALISRYTFAILGLIVLLHLLVYIAFYLRESRDIEKYAIERSRLFASELVNAITSTDSAGENTERFENLISLIRLSRYKKNDGQMFFRLISSNPVNPQNSPDNFEKEAISFFNIGAKDEHYAFMLDGENPHIRYSRPLSSRPECKNCHEEKKFRDGELRGAVSVSLPVSDSLQRFEEKKGFYIWSSVTLILAVSLVVLSLAFQLGRQIKASYKIEEESAQTDTLTGLPTRAYILDRLRQEANRAARHDTPLSAVLVSIDHLGAVNNRYGQKAGDAVLMELSSLALKNLRDYDMIGRYGGEEYLVVLPFTKLEAAREVAERLRSDIENLAIHYKGKIIKVTVSAGVVQWLGENENIDQLLHRLGVAQYNAQANGRNRVETDDLV